MREGFEHEKVDAFVGQHRHLFAIDSSQFIRFILDKHLAGLEDGSDRTSDQRLVSRRFPCQSNGGSVDLFELIRQSMALQFESVGTKGIGLDYVRPGIGILLVDSRDELGVGNAQVFVARIDEHAFRVDHRAHRAVEDERALFDSFQYLFHIIHPFSPRRGAEYAAEFLCKLCAFARN